MMGLMVTFSWVPVHRGVKGNRMADRTAKEATKRISVDLVIYISWTEIKSRI